VEKLAKQKDVSMATIALAWCVAKGAIPIVGIGSIGKVNDTVKALKLAKSALLKKENIEFLEEKYVAKPNMAAV
jgi:aryl-alcohol dehydrogenase-like predicted oxidoreductase